MGRPISQPHPSNASYVRGCPCEECKAAHAAYVRSRRALYDPRTVPLEHANARARKRAEEARARERNDPRVAAAAEKLDRTVDEILNGPSYRERARAAIAERRQREAKQ